MEPVSNRLRAAGKYLKGFGMILAFFVLTAVAAAVGVLLLTWLGSYSSPISMNTRSSAAPFGERCNVMGIEVHGCISSYGSVPSDCDMTTASQDILGYIAQAKRDGTKAILLDIDSPGGEPEAAAEVADALKDAKIPAVAWIRGYGDSAAYWIASAADVIVAGPTSDVGSIGVTQSYIDNSKQDLEQGITYNELSTGKYKDIGSPDKPLTADERAYLQKQLQTMLDQFIQTVADNRHLPVEKVRALADGSTMLGQQALMAGLIDTLGYEKEAKDALKSFAKEIPIVCWPQYQ